MLDNGKQEVSHPLEKEKQIQDATWVEMLYFLEVILKDVSQKVSVGLPFLLFPFAVEPLNTEYAQRQVLTSILITIRVRILSPKPVFT